MASLLSYALTTVADVKESLGIDSGDHSKDNLIIRKINQATIMIERYTGRRFKETTYTDEVYDSSGTNQLVLKQRPISNITLSGRDTSLNDNDWDSIDANLFFADSDSGIIRTVFNTTGNWGKYKVTYTAGYATIPEDIAEACATLAAFLVQNGTSGTTVKSKQEGQRKVEYFDSQPSRNNLFEQLGIDEILNSYANLTLI